MFYLYFFVHSSFIHNSPALEINKKFLINEFCSIIKLLLRIFLVILFCALSPEYQDKWYTTIKMIIPCFMLALSFIHICSRITNLLLNNFSLWISTTVLIIQSCSGTSLQVTESPFRPPQLEAVQLRSASKEAACDFFFPCETFYLCF